MGLAGTYALLLAAMAVMFTVAGVMASAYRAARLKEAARHFALGNRMAVAADMPAAIEHYRTALALQPTNSDFRMELAQALLRAGRVAESQTHLKELLQADPTNGPANLTMARIASQSQDILNAETYYHRAIYGLWRAEPQANRLQARLELVELLAQVNERSKLLSELMALAEEIPADEALKRRLAGLFLMAGSPSSARELYQQLVAANRRDAQAYAGLGESEFLLGDYAAAQRDFQAALRLNPEDAASRRRLEVSRNVLALDPTLAGLGINERHLRSRRLMVLALSQLDLCAGGHNGNADPAIASLRKSAQERIAEPVRGRVDEERIEANLSLATELWRARQTLCPPVGSAEEAVGLILGRLARTPQ